jgi:hypothetical protein
MERMFKKRSYQRGWEHIENPDPRPGLLTETDPKRRRHDAEKAGDERVRDLSWRDNLAVQIAQVGRYMILLEKALDILRNCC